MAFSYLQIIRNGPPSKEMEAARRNSTCSDKPLRRLDAPALLRLHGYDSWPASMALLVEHLEQVVKELEARSQVAPYLDIRVHPWCHQAWDWGGCPACGGPKLHGHRVLGEYRVHRRGC